MIGNVDDLAEIWDILDTGYKRPEKYMAGALRPIVEFRRYRLADSAAIREFYSLLKIIIKSARMVGHLKLLRFQLFISFLKLLINDRTVPSIMGKMPHID
jgi:hypothetical protein